MTTTAPTIRPMATRYEPQAPQQTPTQDSSGYAINVGDLVTLREPESTIIIDMLIAPVIQSRNIVDIHPRKVNGVAIVLECDDERAQAIIDIIRLKIPKWRLHCYHKTTGKSWKSI